jgi:hypothetical protein
MAELRYSFTHQPRDYTEVSGKLHAPASLLPGKKSGYPLDRRLGGPQNQSGRNSEESKFPLLAGNGAHVQLVASSLY